MKRIIRKKTIIIAAIAAGLTATAVFIPKAVKAYKRRKHASI